MTTPTPETLRGLVAGMTICSPGCTKCLAEHADILSAADAWEADRTARIDMEQAFSDLQDEQMDLRKRLEAAEKALAGPHCHCGECGRTIPAALAGEK